MKISLATYIVLVMSFFGQLDAQEIRTMPLDLDSLLSKNLDFDFGEPEETEQFKILQTGNDMFSIQLISFELEDFTLGICSRLEEELPYENKNYQYLGFYYLDFGLSYVLNKFNFGFSVENLLNFDSDAFSIDPILEVSNGIINRYYLSHETDAMISFSVAYTFN